MTKLERLKRMRLNGQEFQIDIESDEEDGKIGFVPAECLETHGERLARLNCFKNEELEKNHQHHHHFKNQLIALKINVKLLLLKICYI